MDEFRRSLATFTYELNKSHMDMLADILPSILRGEGNAAIILSMAVDKLKKDHMGSLARREDAINGYAARRLSEIERKEKLIKKNKRKI